MLTIDEIKNVSFRKASFSGGYNAEDVDEFIDEVIASFEQLKKKRQTLYIKSTDLLPVSRSTEPTRKPSETLCSLLRR